MADALTHRLDRLTIRVCEDLGWEIYVSCTRCRTMRLVRGEKTADLPGARVPLLQLLERRLFKCETCDVRAVDQVQVNWTNVGRLEVLVAWELYDCAGQMLARRKAN